MNSPTFTLQHRKLCVNHRAGYNLSAALVLSFLLALGYMFRPNTIVLAQDSSTDDFIVSIGQLDTSNYPEITIFVSVTDSKGEPVAGLSAEDFSVTEDGAAVKIVDFAGIGEPRPVDVVYVFDTTGSMSEEIDGVIETSIQFAEELESKGRDYRLGLVTFADQVRAVYRDDNTLTDDVKEFKAWVRSLGAEGGGGDEENDYGAIKRAVQMQFRDEAQRIIILITDAPPHHYGDFPDEFNFFDDPDLTKDRALALLNQEMISIYSVTPAEPEFIALASETGGKFYDINRNPDFTAIIEEIGETIASQYKITYISPRPTYDGTRRDIVITIGEVTVSEKYTEEHLLHIQSDPLVGVVCLAPLLLGVLLPFGVHVLLNWRRSQVSAQAVPSVSPALPVQPPVALPTKSAKPSPEETASAQCSHCGRPLRQGARFCAGCGQSIAPAMAPTPAQTQCPNCRRSLRPDAKFCAGCGKRL